MKTLLASLLLVSSPLYATVIPVDLGSARVVDANPTGNHTFSDPVALTGTFTTPTSFSLTFAFSAVIHVQPDSGFELGLAFSTASGLTPIMISQVSLMASDATWLPMPDRQSIYAVDAMWLRVFVDDPLTLQAATFAFTLPISTVLSTQLYINNPTGPYYINSVPVSQHVPDTGSTAFLLLLTLPLLILLQRLYVHTSEDIC